MSEPQDRAVARREWTEDEWAERLSEPLGVPVQVHFTRALRTPVQVRDLSVQERGRPAARPGSGYLVRLHGMFRVAPEALQRDVASWIRNGRRSRAACKRIDAFIAEATPRFERTRAPRKVTLAPRGERYDLDELMRLELESSFPTGLDRKPPTITWGRRARSRSRHSLRLGSYEPRQHHIRLHPVLDQPAVPEWFVRFVVFHELLHAALPPRPDESGRWIHHSPEFRARERRHPDHARAHAWEVRHLPELIRSARTGKPAPMKPQLESAAAMLKQAWTRWRQGSLF